MRGSNDLFVATETNILADGFQAAAHIALGSGAVAEPVIDAGDKRNDGRGTGADEGDGRALAGVDLELIRYEQSHSEAYRCLRKGHEAGHGKVFAKLGNG